MSDEINEADVRQTRDVAARMHETNEAKRTEYRMDPGLAAASLTWALDALDAERARVAEWTAEARERDAEVARWQSEARDLGRAIADVRQRCGGYPDSRVDGDGGIVAVVVRERDEARARAERAEARCAALGTDPSVPMELPSVLATMAERLGVAESERDEVQAALVALWEALPRVAEMAFRAGYDKCTETWAPEVDEGSDGSCPECGCGQDRDGWDEAFRALPEKVAEIAAIIDGVVPSAIPATLAGQVRARVLREAVVAVERWMDTDDDPLSMIDRLRTLADEAERAK